MTRASASRRVLGRDVRIVGTRDDARLDDALYAVNWFNARRPRVYDAYNALAAFAAGPVGARAHFKGRRVRTLDGDPRLERDTLLLVRYPDARAFLRMLATPWFMAVSPLREVSVRRFRFALTARCDPHAARGAQGSKKRAGRRALVHHADAPAGALAKAAPALAEAAEAVGARLHYAGETVARLEARGKGPKPAASALVIIDAPTGGELAALRESDAWTLWRDGAGTRHLGVFERVW